MLGHWKSYFKRSQASSAASFSTRKVGLYGLPEYEIADGLVVLLSASTPEVVFGRIYAKAGNSYREVGPVSAYHDRGDAEAQAPHWRAEVYVSQNSYSDAMTAGLGEQLLAHTACEEPLLVNVAFGERTGGRYKTFGKVWLDED